MYPVQNWNMIAGRAGVPDCRPVVNWNMNAGCAGVPDQPVVDRTTD
jgi:hypothetical protein